MSIRTPKNAKRSKRSDEPRDIRKRLMNELDEYVRDRIMPLLYFELVLGVAWVVLMIISYFVAINEFIPLMLAAFHASATLAALICLEFFIGKDEPDTLFMDLIWQVPTAIALITDLASLAYVIKVTLLPAWHGHVEPGGASLPLGIAITILFLLLATSSVVLTVLFTRITAMSKHIFQEYSRV
jgi:hypothetical protein